MAKAQRKAIERLDARLVGYLELVKASRVTGGREYREPGSQNPKKVLPLGRKRR